MSKRQKSETEALSFNYPFFNCRGRFVKMQEIQDYLIVYQLIIIQQKKIYSFVG